MAKIKNEKLGNLNQLSNEKLKEFIQEAVNLIEEYFDFEIKAVYSILELCEFKCKMHVVNLNDDLIRKKDLSQFHDFVSKLTDWLLIASSKISANDMRIWNFESEYLSNTLAMIYIRWNLKMVSK